MYPLKKFSLGEMKGFIRNKHQTVGEPILYKLFSKKYSEIVQKCIPACIKPNFITILGFIVMFSSFLLNVWFDGKLENYPKYLPLVNAFSILFYITSDSVDGIHARATKQCSPIGKLLDHFIDSNVLFFTLVGLCSSMKTGISSIFLCLFFSLFTGFFIDEIAEKFTGVLVFPPISGACEGLYFTFIMHLTAFISPSSINYLQKLSLKYQHFYKILAVLYFIYLILDLFYYLKMSGLKINWKIFLISLIRFFILLALFIPIYLFRSTFPLLYFLTFAQCFSLNFLEEYVSLMTQFPINISGFFFSCFILFLQGIGMYFLKESNLANYIQIVSSLHFLIRSYSVLTELAHGLGVHLFRIY